MARKGFQRASGGEGMTKTHIQLPLPTYQPSRLVIVAQVVVPERALRTWPRHYRTHHTICRTKVPSETHTHTHGHKQRLFFDRADA